MPDNTLVRVSWMDSEGTSLADATLLRDIPKTIETILSEGGRVYAVGLLEVPVSC
jgi:hypothetical protein